MGYLTSWDDFARQAEQMQLTHPEKTRFSLKYRHKDAYFVLKVTDDAVCLKFRSDQLQDVKRMEKLNNQLMRHMVNKHGEAAAE